jgi:hypothetical protein
MVCGSLNLLLSNIWNVPNVGLNPVISTSSSTIMTKGVSVPNAMANSSWTAAGITHFPFFSSDRFEHSAIKHWADMIFPFATSGGVEGDPLDTLVR